VPATRRNYSRKREAILRTIQSTKTHPSADWVFSTMRSEFPDISLATVYRNISEFKNDGVIRSVGFVHGQERFDADTSEHCHFICTDCGALIDIDASCFQPLAELREATGLDIRRSDTTFYGICPDCKQPG